VTETDNHSGAGDTVIQVRESDHSFLPARLLEKAAISVVGFEEVRASNTRMAPSAGLPSRSALVLYGSETGNAQDVAEDIGRLCERLRFSTHVAELDSISLVCV
jgi:sulfite reductase alpha subunit-like flavoprotein